ncbi:hypothetical protein QOZ80_5AG0361980 [Eleusine coracana subsp. coracana]|nr:hypothetical protein QOZ80_5AG0361980 [Eleusine coracana subsp. coracana]
MLERYYSSIQNQSQEHERQSMEEAAAAFSLFFPLPNNNNNKKKQWRPDYCDDDHSSVTTSPSSSSTGSVDCTLSLWTPSSRLAAADHHSSSSAAPPDLSNTTKQPAYQSVSWDDVAAAATDQHQRHFVARQQKLAKACDAFVDRRCANCGTSSTPLWRNGPRGPKSLCNACGIRFKKEERRAAATAAMDNNNVGCGYVAQYDYGATMASHGEAAADPFLAWRLNVVAPAWPDRTSLFHYN